MYIQIYIFIYIRIFTFRIIHILKRKAEQKNYKVVVEKWIQYKLLTDKYISIKCIKKSEH